MSTRPGTTGTVTGDALVPEHEGRSSDYLSDELARQMGQDLAALDYHAQAGCPREHSGGSYRPNVAGPSASPPRTSDPKPFKLR